MPLSGSRGPPIDPVVDETILLAAHRVAQLEKQLETEKGNRKHAEDELLRLSEYTLGHKVRPRVCYRCLLVFLRQPATATLLLSTPPDGLHRGFRADLTIAMLLSTPPRRLETVLCPPYRV